MARTLNTSRRNRRLRLLLSGAQGEQLTSSHHRLMPTNGVHRVLYAYQEKTGRVYGQGIGSTSLAWYMFNAEGDVVAKDESFYDFSPLLVDRVWVLKGNVFVQTKDGSNNYLLYRSTDNGTTFSVVFTPGEGNGPASADSTNVSFLDYGLGEGPGSTIYGCEYNVNGARTAGSTNDRVRYIKSDDNGATWSTIYTFNTDGSTNNLRHGHCVGYDAQSGNVYFGNGDAGNHASFIEWDGASSFPADNGDVSVFDSTSGFNALYGQQRYRVINFVFTEDYIYTASDTSDAGETGVWRFPRGLASFTRMSEAWGEYTSYVGWSGFQHSSGKLFWCSSSQTTGEFNTIHASNDGTDWEEIGRTHLINTATNSSSATPYSFIEINDGLVIHSTRRVGGLASGLQQTGIYRLRTAKSWKGQRDNLLPLAFVSPDAPSSPTANRLGDPSADEWIDSLDGILEDDIITYGHRVVVKPGSYEATFQITPSWDGFNATYAVAANLASAVQVTGDGSVDFTLNYGSTADFIRHDHLNHAVIFEHMTVDRDNGSVDGDLVQTATNPVVAVFRDCNLGSAASRNRFNHGSASTIVTLRCRIAADSSVATALIDPANASCVHIMFSCVGTEGYRVFSNSATGATVIVLNNLLYGLVNQFTNNTPDANWHVYNNIIKTSFSNTGGTFVSGNFDYNWSNVDTSTAGGWGTNARINETSDFGDVSNDDFSISATNPYVNNLDRELTAALANKPGCLTDAEFDYDLQGNRMNATVTIGPVQ